MITFYTFEKYGRFCRIYECNALTIRSQVSNTSVLRFFLSCEKTWLPVNLKFNSPVNQQIFSLYGWLKRMSS